MPPLFNPDFRLAPDLKIHRSRHRAHLMRPVMDVHRFRHPPGIGDLHLGPQHYPREFARSIRVFHHLALRVVDVFGDHDSGVGAQVQNPQHVARRERAHHQFFRVVSRRVAAEEWIRRTGNWRPLPRRGYFQVAAIGLVGRGSRARIPGPAGADPIAMVALTHHHRGYSRNQWMPSAIH